MVEKRKIKRRHLIYYLKVLETKTNEVLGYLVDITTQGIMIMSEEPIEVDKTFHLKMLVQSEMSNKEYLQFDATSKWCRKSINSDFYDSGFELLNMPTDDFKKIEEIIEELGFRDR